MKKTSLLVLGLWILQACGDGGGGREDGEDDAAPDPVTDDGRDTPVDGPEGTVDVPPDVPDTPDSPGDGEEPDGPALCPGDEFAAWAGGSSYYARWENGPPADPSYFPIAVWLQSPSNAEAYAALGVNLFVGLWEGPTQDQLDRLAAAGMETVCDQNETGLSSPTASTILAWMHGDEPDNAQWTGSEWGSCILPEEVQAGYAAMTAADSTRPVYLNLGQGVAWEDWYGRGDVCAGHDEHYAGYAEGADILSFDIYPVNSTDDPVSGNLWYVAHGVDRLLGFCGNARPVWVWIESTKIGEADVRPTPLQVRAEVWMAIIHGAMGIGYFCHEFNPFVEAGLLQYPEIVEEVTALDGRIAALAPVLNTPTVANGVTTVSSSADVPVDTMLKRTAEATYLFAVAMRDGRATAQFTLTCVPDSGPVEVIGEDRTLTLSARSFSDDFEGYGVHLYRIAP
jgi:hypothetical protein